MGGKKEENVSPKIMPVSNHTMSSSSSAIFSPDGTRLALVASGADQRRRICVRSLDQLQATLLSGRENADSPFFA
jgi:hypothetical protein